MLHASPGSSRHLEKLVDGLSKGRRVLAPDTPGNGDSTPLANPSPEIIDYAQALIEFLEANHFTSVDLFGSHTGAHIAVEAAILAPQRINRVILDGLSIYSEEQRRDLLENYAPAITPDINGSQFLWAFQYGRDQAMFFPWFNRTAAGLRGRGMSSARDLHTWTVELLRSLDTYHLGYRAAFRHIVAGRLPLVKQRTLAIAVPADPLKIYLDQVAALLPNCALVSQPLPETGDTTSAVVREIDRFLKE